MAFFRLIGVALALSGCVAVNPFGQFTVDGERDAGMTDAGMTERDAGPLPIDCRSDADCAPPTPICDSTRDQCVAACTPTDARVTRLAPIVVFVVPSSNSTMNLFVPTGTETIWNAIQAAFSNTAASPIARFESFVRFGLALFHGEATACPAISPVLPTLNNSLPVFRAIESRVPGGESPLADVLRASSALMLGGDPAGTAVIHIVPNIPDTCAVPNPNMGDGEALSEAAMLGARGVRSFAIGLADLAMTFPTQLAAVGGGQAWDVRDDAAFSAALEQAIRAAAPCRVSIEGGSLSAANCNAVVTLGGMELTCGGADGWHVVDPTTIELSGIACRAMQDNPNIVPTVSFVCP